MEQYISEQLEDFGLSLIMGCGMAFFYDVLRVFRRLLKHSLLLINIEDILFFCVVSVYIVHRITAFNSYELRGFIMLGMAIGAILWMATFGYAILFVVESLKKNIKKYTKTKERVEK